MKVQWILPLLSLAASAQAKIVDRQLLTYAPLPEGTYEPPTKPSELTLLDFIHSREELSSLSDVVSGSAGFTQAFATSPGWQYTFFAPSNTAFNNTGQYFETFAETAKGKWWLGQMLQHHYVPNTRLYRANFTESKTRTQTGSYLYIGTQLVDDELVINGVATVTEADIPVTNGVVHIVDRIIGADAMLYEGDIKKTPQNFIAGSCSNPDLPYC